MRQRDVAFLFLLVYNTYYEFLNFNMIDIKEHNMSLFLSVLVCLFSVGILAGRIYEIISLTDPVTGFLITKGIALNPVLLALFILITVCSGVIIFGNTKTKEIFYSKSSGIIAMAAGVAFVAYGIMLVMHSTSAVLMIVGGIAWFLIGMTGLGDTAKDAVIMVLLTVFTAGLCLDIIAFDVYSIYYTAFMHKVLSYVSIMVLVLAVLKNTYLPSGKARMMLFISGFICFAFSGMMGIAEIICFIASGQGFSADVIKELAFVLVGVYGLDNALSVLPDKNADEAEEADTDKVYAEAQTVNNEEAKNCLPREKERTAEMTVKPFLAKEKTVFKESGSVKAKTEKIVYKKPKE